MDWVRRNSVRVRRSSGLDVAKLRCGVAQLGCGVVQSAGNASACCKAGPSSILSSAPHGVSSIAEQEAIRIQEDRPRRMVNV
jgi:hypothetical protein